MPLVAAAVCPHPPLIIPEIAGAAAPELDDLRAACDAAVDRLWRSGARRLVIIGGDDATRGHHFPFVGSFAPWGVRITVHLDGGTDAGGTDAGGMDAGGAVAGGAVAGGAVAGDVGAGRDRGADMGAGRDRAVDAGGGGRSSVPLSLLVGAWLVGRRPAGRAVAYEMIGLAPTAPADAWRPGAAAHRADSPPWALLVMGDGSACRGEKAPGYVDPRAEPYDDAVAEALAAADTDALLALDAALSAELKVAGRASWQALAGAVRAAGGQWRADLSYHAAPYGVGYFVANWDRTWPDGTRGARTPIGTDPVGSGGTEVGR